MATQPSSEVPYSPAPPDGFEPIVQGKGFSNLLGQVYVDRANNRFGMWVTPIQGNPVDTLHGGAMATFADLQLLALLGRGKGGAAHCPTISLSVDYLAPTPMGSWLEGQVTMTAQTKNMYFTQALMTVDGKPVARSSAIYRNRQERKPDHGRDTRI